MDIGAWQAVVHRVTKSWTQLKLRSKHAQWSLSLLKFLERLQLKVLQAGPIPGKKQNDVMLDFPHFSFIYPHDKYAYLPETFSYFW